jgi:hypothetical protein
MARAQIRIQPLVGSKNMNIADRAKGKEERRSSSGPFSWYIAQRSVPESKYVLTINGYVILP